MDGKDLNELTSNIKEIHRSIARSGRASLVPKIKASRILLFEGGEKKIPHCYSERIIIDGNKNTQEKDG